MDDSASTFSEESEDSVYVRDLEAQADCQYERNLKREVLDVLGQVALESRQREDFADCKYDQYLGRKSLDVLRERLCEAEDLERQRRLRMFRAWKDRKLTIAAMHTWIIRHRENVVRKQVEDDKDIHAVTTAMSKWRLMALETQERKQEFRIFFVALKFARKWREVVRERQKSRAIAVLEQKYHSFRHHRDRKVLQRSLSRWREQAVKSAATEAAADDRLQRSESQRNKSKAHEALSTMYTAAARTVSMEAAADAHHQKSMALRVLSPDGQWRRQTRITQEREEVADEFRAIKDEAKAQRVVRKMRNTAAWGRTMDDEADAFFDRTTNAIGRRAISTWREAAASKRGEAVIREPPATPAARMAALRQYQQSQNLV
jgi:hypothetical protein